jgi:hypothetical protein
MTSDAIAPKRRRRAPILSACLLSASAALVWTALDGHAQQAPAAATGAAASDPRVGLEPGFRDAGSAARNLELVASLPKPDGFFNPKAPAGDPVPAEREAGSPEATAANAAAAAGAGPAAPAPGNGGGSTNGSSNGAASGGGGQAPPEGQPAMPGKPAAQAAAPAAAQGRQPGADRAAAAGAGFAAALNFANSDLAFSGNHLFVGNFNGVNIYDIGTGKKPKLLASIVCPGGQGDVSIRGHLLMMSVEQTRGRIDCGMQGVTTPVSTERFRGVRIFDITDMKHPKQVAAVQTCRGSHTHTVVDDPKDKANFYIYGSGTSTVRSGDELEGCSSKDPKEDPNTALFSIDVIQVPMATPDKAKVINRPRVFADEKTGNIAGLWAGGNHGTGTQTTRLTNECHDITVYPELGLAAGACAGNGILLDISDPVHPKRLDNVIDANFAFWHSATFNNDGTKVLFTDEWGGGVRPRCRSTDLPNWGADAIFDIVDHKMKFAGYFKIPAAQTEQENCVAHNGSLIPVPGRDLMVQAWYQGGISVFDFSDTAHPVEIAFFDRGPLDAKNLITGGYWSAYWYNGSIYGSEIARGLDVFKLKPSDLLSQNEIDAAMLVKSTEFNAQEQPKANWPAATVVSRAYVDQLTRSKALAADRAAAVNAALTQADKVKGAKDQAAAGVATELDTLASQFEKDASAASGVDAKRMQLLASSLKGRAAALHASAN